MSGKSAEYQEKMDEDVKAIRRLLSRSKKRGKPRTELVDAAGMKPARLRQVLRKALRDGVVTATTGRHPVYFPA